LPTPDGPDSTTSIGGLGKEYRSDDELDSDRMRVRL